MSRRWNGPSRATGSVRRPMRTSGKNATFPSLGRLHFALEEEAAGLQAKVVALKEEVRDSPTQHTHD